MIGLLLHNVNLQSDLYTLLLKSHVNGEFVWLLKKSAFGAIVTRKFCMYLFVLTRTRPI